MIAKLSGWLDSVGLDSAVIDVGGVGYDVYCSGRTLRSMPAMGEPVKLFVETHVREDHIHLYGFVDMAERDWFRLLLTVQGVGAKVALAILTVLTPAELTRVIVSQDRASVTQANGVGAKLAGRIVTELRDAVGKGLVGPDSAMAGVAAAADLHGSSEGDAVSALVNLGYRRSEAVSAVAGALRDLGDGAAVDDLIRGGLREMGR